MLSDNFTNRLNQAMKSQNLRQVDLIKKTKDVMKKYIKDYNGDGIDKTLLNKYIKGIAIAKQDNIFILAKALNVSESWLMGYDVEMTNESQSINNDDLSTKVNVVSDTEEIIELLNDLDKKKKEAIINFIKSFK